MYLILHKSTEPEIRKAMEIFEKESSHKIDIILMSIDQWTDLLKPSKLDDADIKITQYLPWQDYHIILASKELFNDSRYTYEPYIDRYII